MPKGRLWLVVVLAAAAWPAMADETAGESCLASAVPTIQLSCLAEAARAAGDVGPCLLSDQPGVAWQCVAIYAEQTHDSSLCGVIPRSDEAPRDVGRDLCRVHLALSWRQPGLCEGLATPGLRDACLFEFVETGGDAALCARIADPDLKGLCGSAP